MKTELKKFNRVYETDASGVFGNAVGVVFPESVQEVRDAVRKNRKIVIRGGGSGLAGGAVPQHGQDVVLDLSKLVQISNLDLERKTVEVDAGVILDDLQDYLSKYNLEFPVNPGSHAVATVGGMIATDAVGMRAVKYGKVSNWIRWVEVVDSSGNVERKGLTEVSDYAGMEGITGVIVRACLKLSEKKERTATLLSFSSVDEIVNSVAKFKRDSAVSMVEFLDKFVSKGIGLDEKYHLIVEFENDSGELKGDAYADLMAKRDEVYPFLSGEGYTRIEDPKIIYDKLDKILGWFEVHSVPVFGHLGVGILHPCFRKEQENLIPEMMKRVKRIGGSVSGEHGIGLLKREFVEPNDRKILANVKKRTDPANKFNSGKVI